jgi:dynein heavy chain
MQAGISGSDKLCSCSKVVWPLFLCFVGRAGGMQLELQSSDLKERYRTRLLYAISDADKAAAAEELDDACMLDLEWADLVTTAEAVDAQLEGIKKRFSQITRQQVSSDSILKKDLAVLGVHLASTWGPLACNVLTNNTGCRPQVSEFAAVTESLAARMHSEGPGLPTVQLAAGFEQLRTLQAEVTSLGKQQEELRMAEQLFGMNVTSFPHLNKVWHRRHYHGHELSHKHIIPQSEQLC